MVGAAARRRSEPELLSRLAVRVRDLAAAYEAPSFDEAPGPDAALFLCAVDHRSGYRSAHPVDGEGPYEGSDLLWALGCAAERCRPRLLAAVSLREVDVASVENLFEVGGETAAGAEQRARLWRDLAAVLIRAYDGSAEVLLAAAGSRLGGPGGLIARLAGFEAFADPLAKKSYLFAKIAARRGWFDPVDPECWEVCADNVLMRLALRSGLVQPGPVDAVRADTRASLKRLAAAAGVEPPLLDDLLWERGRRNPDLLGTAGGSQLTEPARPKGMLFY